MSRVTRAIRIDEELDAYIRSVTFDPFTRRISHGAYSDIINAALLAWKAHHEALQQNDLTKMEPAK